MIPIQIVKQNKTSAGKCYKCKLAVPTKSLSFEYEYGQNRVHAMQLHICQTCRYELVFNYDELSTLNREVRKKIMSKPFLLPVDMNTHIRFKRETHAARVIEKHYCNARDNPEFRLCRMRLRNECMEMNGSKFLEETVGEFVNSEAFEIFQKKIVHTYDESFENIKNEMKRAIIACIRRQQL